MLSSGGNDPLVWGVAGPAWQASVTAEMPSKGRGSFCYCWDGVLMVAVHCLCTTVAPGACGTCGDAVTGRPWQSVLSPVFGGGHGRDAP